MNFSQSAAVVAAKPGMRSVLPFMPFVPLAAMVMINKLIPQAANGAAAYSLAAYGTAALLCFFLISPFEPAIPEIAECFGWKRIDWRLLPWLAAGLFILSVAVMKLTFTVIGGEPEMQPLLRAFLQMRGWRLAMTFLVITIPVPLIEEWVFRHYLFGGLTKWLGWAGAAAATSLIFASIHLCWPIIPGLFVLGMAWQLVYLGSGSLGYAALLHACNNAIALTLALLTA